MQARFLAGRWLAVILGTAGPLCVATAGPPNVLPKQAIRKPAIRDRVPFYTLMSGSDRKVALHAFDLLWAATEEQDWHRVQGLLRRLVAARLVAGPWESEAVTALTYCYLFSAYVPEFRDGKLTGPELAEFQRWLLTHPELTRRFIFGIADADQPGPATGIVHLLYKNLPERAVRFPDLTTAMAVVFDEGTPSETQLLDTFRWLTDSRLDRAWNVGSLPHELARYLLDVRLSRDDRFWAYARYRTRPNLEKIYDDLEYDEDAFSSKRPKKIQGFAYTLPNLLAVGGTCVDQTYYANQIGRTLGFPMVTIEHGGPGTIGHRWCLQLVAGANGYRWQEVGGSGFGWITDPATGRKGSDQTLGFLLGSLAQLETQREIASALTQIVLRIPDWNRAAVPTESNELRALTETKYDPTATPAYYLVRRQLQPGWVIQEALRADPYHATTWAAIEALGAVGSLRADELALLYQQLARLIGTSYPDVLYLALTGLHLKLPPDQEVHFIEAALASLTKQQLDRAPDMLGRLLIQAGEVLSAQGETAGALDRYERAIGLNEDDLSTTVRAVELAWPLAAEFGRLDRLDAAIRLIFEKTEDAVFGQAIGAIAAKAGRSRQAVEWLRYVFDGAERDLPGRYDALRKAIDLLFEMQELEPA
ncbi:MAG: hypothetical protein IID37_06300, partial [Planctomycetes bacterium]|nr:hypothetical protein [Planctomycetota bacterium]